eukprot:82757_1
MGCIHSLDQSLDDAANTKYHHERCATTPPPPPSECTPSSLHNRNSSGIIHYKPREMLITDDSMQYELPNPSDLQNKMRKMMFTNSTSLRSVISNTCTATTTMDYHVSPHIQQNSRITLNYTIDDSHHLSVNDSPPPPPMTNLTLDNNSSNTLIMESVPIFAYKKRSHIKRSRSVDPPDANHTKKRKHKRTRTHNLAPNPNKYAYNQQKNGKINTNKSKRRLVHAKSKSIPYNIFSSDLNKYQNEETDNYDYLSQVTHFDQNTLRLLHLRFNHIYIMSSFTMDDACMDECNDTKMKLDVSAISHIFGLPAHCILVQRFFWYMDQQGLGQLSFRVFARTMSLLSDKASISEKCELSFQLYDLNNDHVIDRNELKQIIYDLMHSAKHLMDPLLMELMNDTNCDFIDKLLSDTMKMFDLDANGNITYRAYCSFMEKQPRLLSPFTLDIEKLLDFEAEKRRMHRISLKSLQKKQLRQLVIGMDPKLRYNKKWKKPQFIKDMEKDEVHDVNTINSPQQICQDLFDDRSSAIAVTPSSPTDSDQEEKEKEERLQRTIDFLYED